MGDEGLATPGHRLTRRSRASSREPSAHRDLQTLLAQAVVQIGESSDLDRVVAWGREWDGRPSLLAASLRGPARIGPTDEALGALEGLERASDLGSPGVHEALAALISERGLTMAAPVRAGSGPAVAFLLAGGPRDPAGGVRPRTLAALDAGARRLSLPLAAVLSGQRLAALDTEVRRLDRLAKLGDLVAEIVHEIRNPLVSVKTFLQLLPDREGDPEFRRNFYEVASEELRRLERLLDAILEHARPGEPEPEGQSADVAGVIRSIERLVSHRAAEKGVALSVQLPIEPTHGRLSEDALRQVMLNLILNAIEASPAESMLRLGVARSGDTVTIEVEDQGLGIPEELRERVFEPFFTTRRERPGGLGLAIARRIAEEAGGSLRAHAGEAGGSLLRLVLPIAP